MRKIELLLCFIFFSLAVIGAESDSAIVLKTATVEGFRPSVELAGLKSTVPDSLNRSLHVFGSLDALIARENIYIKTYGPSQLASLSWRGGSGYHSGIIWNGMNIIDPMTGITDFSLFRPFLFDDFKIQYGGSSAMTGSGNLSGSLLVGNHRTFNSGWSLKAGSSFSSTGNFTQLLGISFGGKKTTTSLQAFTENALNRFNFYEGKNIKEQPFAQSVQRGFTFNQSFITGKKSVVDLLLWYQFADRNISPALYQSYLGAKQKDENIRSAISWKRSGRLNYQIRTAFFNNMLLYLEKEREFSSQARTQTIQTEAEINYLLSESHSAGVMGNFSRLEAETKDYGTDKYLSRKWVTSYYDFTSKDRKWKGTFNIRREFFELFRSSPTFTSGITRSTPKTTLRFSASSLHRNPTLNDLYWNPGGNPSLQPERGFGYEAGIVINADQFLKSTKNRSTFSIDLSFYSRRVKNWIQWIPNGIVWSPQNLDEVWSRGLETIIKHSKQWGNLRISSSAQVSYTVSTKERSSFASDETLHKQLIYVPMYNAFANLTIGYRHWALRIEESYCGYRFTAADHSDYLMPYFISNIHLIGTLKVSGHDFQVTASAENLFNTDYALIQNKPQPLRWFRAGVLLNIQK